MLRITDIKETPEAATSHGATNKTDKAYTETENKSMIFCDEDEKFTGGTMICQLQ